MNIKLKTFVNILTYNGLFDCVSLLNYPEVIDHIKNDPDYIHECYIDEHNILWTVEGWISECKRINALNDASARWKHQQDNDPAILKQRIIQLAMQDKFDEVIILQKRLKELTQ